MNDREITNDVFIMPEFRNAKPEDYERRPDGQIVRKDHWETGIRNIAAITGIHKFEVKQIVERVRQLVSHELAGWKKINYDDPSTLPCENMICLVDWVCLDYHDYPQVLIWGKRDDVAHWIDIKTNEWAGYGLDIPNPTHFKYVGKRPDKTDTPNN